MYVRIEDINQGNHLKAGSLINMVHNARLLFLNSLGYCETHSSDISIIMRHINCHFISQTHFNDKLISPADKPPLPAEDSQSLTNP